MSEDRARLLKDLKYFVSKSFSVLNPSTEISWNFHLDLLIEYLRALEKGHIKRLLINVPPRYLKSQLINVIYPSYVMLKDSSKRIISASYSVALSQKHALDSKQLLNSSFATEFFPDFELSKTQNTKSKFMTTRNGFRYSTSVLGTLTGEGGDLLILDDPQNPVHIHSKTYRQTSINWFKEVFLSRLNDKNKGAVIVVMQRLHKDDLSSHLIEKGNFETVTLKAIEDKEVIYSIGDYSYRREKDTALHPEREDINLLKQMQKEMGNAVFSAQYQQTPLLDSSEIFKASWLSAFKYYDKFLKFYQSWDTAIKVTENSDYSVCTTWAVCEDKFLLVDILREKLPFHILKNKVKEQYELFNPTHVLIEDKSSGGSIIDVLNLETKMPIIPIVPKVSKLERFLKVQGIFESGKVQVKEEYMDLILEEFLSFPNGRHDDLVDSVTQFLNYFKERPKTISLRQM